MRTATAYEDLAFHALTFVPPRSSADFDRAVSLWDEGWHARAEAIDPALVAGFREDATILGELARQSDHLATLQGLPRVFASVEALEATGRALLAEIADHEGVDPTWLAALRGMPPALVEILRANMLLVADRFVAAHEAHLMPEEARVLDAERAIFEAASATFDLRGVTLVVSQPLGDRGRGFGDTIYVGASVLGAGSGGLVALGVYERVVDTATETFVSMGQTRAWHAAESVALEAYARLTRGTPIADQADALLARFAGFDRDAAIAAEDVERVIARLRLG